MKFQTTPIKTDKGFRFYIENDELFLDTNSGEQITLNSDEDKTIGLQKLENGYVLSISEKNVLKFWDSTGKLKSSFLGHESELIYLETQRVESKVKDQRNYVLVTISKLDKVVIHDLKGKELSAFDIEMARPEKFRCFENGIGFLIADKGLVYYRWNGKEFFRFKDMKEGISDWKQLGNGFVVTDSNLSPDERVWWGGTENGEKSQLGICLWSGNGDLIKGRMEEAFNFYSVDDIEEFSSDSFIITSKDSTIFIVDSKGSQLNCHRPIVEINSKALMQYRLTEDGKRYQNISDVNDVLSKCKADSSKVLSHIKDNPSILDYKHRSNPVRGSGSEFIPNKREKIEGKSRTTKDKDVLKKVWSFFNRPVLNDLFNTLQPQERGLNKSLIKLDKIINSNTSKVEFLNKEINKSTTVLKVLTLLTVLTALVFVGLNDMPAASIAGALSIVLVLFLLNKAIQAKRNLATKMQIDENNETLSILVRHFKPLVDQITDYRHFLISQLPIIKDPKLYSSDFVAEHINQVISDEIEKRGRIECGIDSSEVVYKDQKAIKLSDWSLIQTKDAYTQNKFKNDDHRVNELSFFSVPGKGVQFAVQRIQLIFLSKEKLDVFTAFYDFIENEFISKQTHSFYYKDVTNVSSKDVSRDVPYEEWEKGIPTHAQAVTLKVSSGDKIEITMQNDDTYNEMIKKMAEKRKTEDSVDDSVEDRVEELEAKIKEVEAESSLSSELKDNFTLAWKAEIESIKVPETKKSHADQDDEADQNDEVNQKINSIRSLIYQYKKVTEE